MLKISNTEISTAKIHHHHKHQGLDPLIRSVSRVTAARTQRFFGLPIVLLPCGL